jgi:glycosyltransferase involved in cell wall biosynthesis
MPNKPTISVAMCTFNAGVFLDPQVQSIFAQSLLPTELVVSDDGSTDDTQQNLEKLRARAPFPIHIHTNKNRLGPAKNFESCFQKCTGDILVSTDQDDLWHPDKLKLLTAALAQPRTLLAFSDMAIIEADGSPAPLPSPRMKSPLTQWQLLGFSPAQQALFHSGEPLRILLKYNAVAGAASAFHRPLLAHAIPFPADYLHDEWLALIAAAIGGLTPIPQPLTYYRRHAAQQVGPATTGFFAQVRYAREKMQAPYFASMARRADALCDRLSKLPPSLLNPGAFPLARQKQDHAHARLNMRLSRLKRWPLAFHEFLSGDYDKYSLGFKSFAQDLFL